MATLHNFDSQMFLENYWQRRHLLIQQSLRGWQNPLSPDVLAGFACEDFVNSRIVSHDKNNNSWQVQHGPFSESSFSKLNAEPWTLLVQSINHFDTDTAKLFGAFSFLPHWRFDDIMVSYASKGGSVGPHVDNYDVFLVQATGQREWQIGDSVDKAVSGNSSGFQILENFQASECYLLNPGDILYLPAGVPHWGIAQDDDCMTFSVGFRAPNQVELFSVLADALIDSDLSPQFYTDTTFTSTVNPGEIPEQSLHRLKTIMKQVLDNDQIFTDSLLSHLSKNPLQDQDVIDTECTSKTLIRPLGSRFYYTSINDEFKMFANGTEIPCDAVDYPLARKLCNDSLINYAQLNNAEKNSVLFNHLLDINIINHEQ